MHEHCDTCGEEIDEEDIYLGDAGDVCEDCYDEEQGWAT